MAVTLTQTNDQQFRDIFICDCYSTEHQVVVHYMIEKEEKKDPLNPERITFPERHELDFEIHLNTSKSFWERLWGGLKYAFGYKSKYGNWDNFMFRPEDADKFIEYLNKLKNNAVEVEAQITKEIEEMKSKTFKKN